MWVRHRDWVLSAYGLGKPTSQRSVGSSSSRRLAGYAWQIRSCLMLCFRKGGSPGTLVFIGFGCFCGHWKLRRVLGKDFSGDKSYLLWKVPSAFLSRMGWHLCLPLELPALPGDLPRPAAPRTAIWKLRSLWCMLFPRLCLFPVIWLGGGMLWLGGQRRIQVPYSLWRRHQISLWAPSS